MAYKHESIRLEVEYWSDLLKELIGGKIVKVLVDANEAEYANDVMFGLLIELPHKAKVALWILSDEEGNAGGRFEIGPGVE